MVALANVELAKIGLPAIGGGGAGISGSSYTPTGIPNAVVNKVTANSGWPGAKNSFTQPTNSSKANITPTFNVNFYGNQNFSTPSQQNGLVDQIRKTMMSDFEKAKMGIY